MNAADAAVCRRNLERVTAELLDAAEKRAAHIAELVKACLPDGRMTAEDAASAYGAAVSMLGYGERDGCRARRTLDCITSSVSVADRAAVASAVRSYLENDGLDQYLKPVSSACERPGRISYFKGPGADRAFDIFAAAISDPSVSYARDFAAACENVYYGRSQFCILPVSNSTDGRLAGFYALAEKYELFGVMRCAVPHGDGQSRYVLFAADASCAKKTGLLSLEMKIPHGTERLTGLLNAASCLCVSCDGVDSLPTEFGTSYLLTFSADGQALCDLLFYAVCEGCDFEITGVYGIEDM